MTENRTLAERCRAVELLVLRRRWRAHRGWHRLRHRGRAALGRRVEAVPRPRRLRPEGLALPASAAALLTGRRSRAVKVRAAELGIAAVRPGRHRQGSPPSDRLFTELDVRPEHTACVGDDTADVALFRRCGLAVAVADACSEALALAHHVTRLPGGRGTVREVIERILRCQGLWPSPAA